MACSTYNLAGIAIDCSNIGGVSAIYISKTEDVTGVTLNTGGTVTAIAMASTKKFKQYAFRRGNSSFTSTGARNDANGTSFFTTEVSATFNRQDTVKRLELNKLFKENVYILIKDNNGEYHLIGYDSTVGGYAASTGLVASSGTNMEDGNNYVLTLSAQTMESPYIVESSVISGII